MIAHTRAHVYGDNRKTLHQPSTLHPAAELDALARQVARLSPSHRDPERFHIDRSEIVRALRLIARRLGKAA